MCSESFYFQCHRLLANFSFRKFRQRDDKYTLRRCEFMMKLLLAGIKKQI